MSDQYECQFCGQIFDSIEDVNDHSHEGESCSDSRDPEFFGRVD